ncbi:MAG: NAD(P) transhydrogenase subunit alpha [Gemmatimonadaceae bacterium]|nr:NAD(P) transhydrogenase subunit alpha [Gemmatimonadaceae bacterium]
MTEALISGIVVFVLASFVGFEVITKVPSLLHTPLTSASNAISGITIVGSMVVVGMVTPELSNVLGTIAVVFAMINVVGGYLVSDRMLAMFGKKKDEPEAKS